MPMISIIVPVYKVEQYIHRCVDSILNQSYSDFELILVDDGSPDCCGEICEEYAGRDSRIHVIHQENGGLSAARNTGIAWVFDHSDSQWLTFIDSDDWIHKDYLRILLDLAVTSESRVSICDFARRTAVGLDEDIEQIVPECMEFRSAYTKHYGMCMTAWAKLYARELFEDIRFPVGKLHEDAYVTHLILLEANKICCCNIPLYYYFTNEEGITRSTWSPRRMDQIEAHALRLAFWQNMEFRDCYLREMTEYIDVLCLQLRQIEETGEKKYQCHMVAIRKKLREMLCTARRYGCYPFVEQYWGEYTQAYPNRMIRIAVYFWLKHFGSRTQTKER